MTLATLLPGYTTILLRSVLQHRVALLGYLLALRQLAWSFTTTLRHT